MAYKLSWNEKTFIMEFHGEVTDAEIMDSCMAFYGHPQFDATRQILVDLLDIQVFDVSDLTIRKVAAMDVVAAFTNPSIMQAIATGTLPKVIVAARLYQERVKHAQWKTEVFETDAEAQDWLHALPELTPSQSQ